MQPRARGTSNNGRRQAEFYPKMITLQIISLQCFHYFTLAFLFQVNSVLYQTTVTIDRIFTDRYLTLWVASGWADVAAIVVGSLVGSVLMAIIVEKSKKCLDFGVTLFLLHLLICTLYNGLPVTLDWWVVHVFATIVMVLLGEYLCSRREMEDIPLLQI